MDNKTEEKIKILEERKEIFGKVKCRIYSTMTMLLFYRALLSHFAGYEFPTIANVFASTGFGYEAYI